MRVVKWEQPSRVLSDHEVDIFFNRPLQSPTMFQFTTNQFETPIHAGAFSLKWITSGQEEYRIGNRTIRLQAGQFLFLNAGEHYSSHIRQTTGSGSIFVPEAEYASAIQAIAPKTQSIIEPDNSARISEVPQCLFTLPKAQLPGVMRLLKTVEDMDASTRTDLSRLLLVEALSAVFNIAPTASLTNYSKRSTRDELIGRVSRAKHEIDASDGQIADLQHLSDIACLSKYYFLRLFREMYGATPMMYARHIRLEKAFNDIMNGAEVKTAARKAGYTDTRAFLRAGQRIGVQPTRN